MENQKIDNSIYSSVIGRSDLPFQIFISERGLGKTYSALDDLYKHSKPDNRYILLRRTGSELQRLTGEVGNPFKKYNINNNTHIVIEGNDNGGLILDKTEDEDNPTLLGYAFALGTFSNVRGMDFSDVTTIIFDEMIPEKHKKRVRGEGEALLHLYETVNRNREFDGHPPVRVYMLGNAINLNNDILLALGIVSTIAEMKIKGRYRFSDRKRGIYIELMENSRFREVKGETALYKLTAGTQFSEEALNNEFTQDDFSWVKKVKLDEYTPAFTYDIYTVYQHKSNRSLYICKKRADGVQVIDRMGNDIMYYRFAPTYRLAVLDRQVYFDDYSTKLVFDALTTRQK